MVSIAELIRKWGPPPEVIRADWAIQLVTLIHASHCKSQFGLDISESNLLLDAAGNLNHGQTPVRLDSDKSLGDGDWKASRAIIDRWRGDSMNGAPELLRAWRHAESQIHDLSQLVDDGDTPVDESTPFSNAIHRTKPKRSHTKQKRFLAIGAIALATSILLGVASWLVWSSRQPAKQTTAIASALPPPALATPAYDMGAPFESGSTDFDQLSTITNLDRLDETTLDTLARPTESTSVELLTMPAFPTPPLSLAFDIEATPQTDASLPTSDPNANLNSPELDKPTEPKTVEIEVAAPADTVLPPRSQTEKTTLLDVALSADLTIRLNLPDRELPMTRGPDGSWQISDAGLNGSPIIASISQEESKVLWQWQAEAIRSAFANSLSNAMLDIVVGGGQPTSVALRSPNIVPDWHPAMEHGETSTVFAMESAPDRTAQVTVDVLAPGSIASELDSMETVTPYRRGERTVRFINPKEKLVSVRTHLEWVGNHRFTLKQRTELQLDPTAPWVSANVPFLDARNQQLEAYRLACQQQLTFLKETYGSVRQEPQRSLVRTQRDRLETTLKQIDLISKRMTSARSLLHDLQTKSQWSLEIATPWPNRTPQTILKLLPSTIATAAQPAANPAATERNARMAK